MKWTKQIALSKGYEPAERGHPNALYKKYQGRSKVFHFCNDCECEHVGYMVKNDIWNQIAKPMERLFLCVKCAGARLGRSLVLEDLTSAQINFAFVIAAKFGLSLEQVNQEYLRWVEFIPPQVTVQTS